MTEKPLTTLAVQAVWNDVLQGIRDRDRTVYILLTTSGGINPLVADSIVYLVAVNQWQSKRIEQPVTRRLIEAVLSKQLGINVQVKGSTVDELPGALPLMTLDKVISMTAADWAAKN